MAKECLSFYRKLPGLVSEATFSPVVCPRGLEVWPCALKTHTQPIGYLTMVFRGPGRVPFTEATKAKVKDLCRLVNDTLVALLEKNLLGMRRLELQSIHEISRLFLAVNHLEQCLELIISSLTILYEPEALFVATVDDLSLKTIFATSFLNGVLRERLGRIDDNFWNSVFLNSTCVKLPSSRVEGMFFDSPLGGEEFVCHLYPLWGAFEPVGVLGLFFREEPDAVALQNIEIFVNFIAIALNNSLIFEYLERESRTDFLTGILNRKGLMEALESELSRFSRSKTPVSVILFDIDDFKLVNDTYGHLAGDLVLKEIACVIKSVIRRSDSAGRYGGEEFVVILPGSTPEEAYNVGLRILSEVQSRVKLTRVTLSGGITSFREGDTPEDVIRRADAAMYEAKKRGKNRLFIYGEV